MNKKGNLQILGAVLFFGALAVFAVYMLRIYIPAITAEPANADALMNALWWGLGCGSIGTIGAVLAKG